MNWTFSYLSQMQVGWGVKAAFKHVNDASTTSLVIAARRHWQQPLLDHFSHWGQTPACSPRHPLINLFPVSIQSFPHVRKHVCQAGHIQCGERCFLLSQQVLTLQITIPGIAEAEGCQTISICCCLIGGSRLLSRAVLWFFFYIAGKVTAARTTTESESSLIIATLRARAGSPSLSVFWQTLRTKSNAIKACLD